MGLYHSGLLEDESQRLWDVFWKRRNVRGIESWAKRRIVRILSGYVRPGFNVLDAGCGTGFFSSYFISQGCDVYSMDYSEEALSIAKRLTENRCRAYIKSTILDAKILSSNGQGFDIIFTDGLLEHYSIDGQDRIITNMKGLKREGGYIINFVPNRFSIWSIVRPFYMRIKERPFVMGDLLGLHKRNGLNVIAYGGINVLPFMVSPERLLGRSAGMLLYCIAV